MAEGIYDKRNAIGRISDKKENWSIKIKRVSLGVVISITRDVKKVPTP